MQTQKSTYGTLNYRFNGKELDPETGNYYYGARYYDPKISVWLSVDPMASERSWLTPYNFVQNNPLMRVDPDGMLDHKWLVNVESGERTYVDNTGGDEDQVVEFIDNDGHALGTTVVSGSDFYSGEIDGNYLAAGVNLWNDDGSVNMGFIAGDDNLRSTFMGSRSFSTEFKTGLLVSSIHQGQYDFIRSSVELGAHLTGKAGEGISYLGYAAALVPGAQPIAGTLIALGSGLTTGASFIKAGISANRGDNAAALVHGTSGILSLVPGLSRMAATPQGKNILRGGNNMKLNLLEDELTK